ncbi:MAG: sigma-70 family RNA polymerase sigma factor [Paramuribaculum sp.]|nr:sigma-70 family RNA polymerase sigma factor [Paramuribaculum sp.]MDE6488984.1 sigma-70 family RNA polymerase sigma factor [Paramuribaculum sp.]
MIFKFYNKKYSDVRIVEAYRSADKRVQQFWYDKCRDQFGKGTSNYGGITDLEREDIFQDSFVLLWDKIDSGQIYVSGNEVWVTTRRGESVIPDLMGYFMRIVKNKYLEHFHIAKKNMPINESVTDSGAAPIDDPYWDEDPEVEKDRLVVLCLQSLPKSCVEILTMFYYEKKSLEQILAERPENSSYDGLKSRKSKCMANLKRKISETFAKAGLR